MSGARPNDTDIQPNKILIHHRPEATTYILKVRTQFCKSFQHKSPAELPVSQTWSQAVFLQAGSKHCTELYQTPPACPKLGVDGPHIHTDASGCALFQFPSRTVGIARSVRPSAHHLGVGSLAPCCYPSCV